MERLSKVKTQEVTFVRRKFPDMLVLLALLLMFAPPVFAQQAPASLERESASAPDHELPGPGETIVTLRLEVQIAVASDGIAMLPMNILERLSNQESLATLDVQTQDRGRIRVLARFMFPSMEQFRSWYESASTQDLLEELNDAGPDGVRLALNVHRRS